MSQSGVEGGQRGSSGGAVAAIASAIAGGAPAAAVMNGGLGSAAMSKKSGSGSGHFLHGGDGVVEQGVLKGGSSGGGVRANLRSIGGSSGALSASAAGAETDASVAGLVKRARSTESRDIYGYGLPPAASGGGGGSLTAQQQPQQHHWTPMGLLRHGSSGGISDPGAATAGGTPVATSRYPQSAHSMQGDGGYSPVRGGGAGAFKSIWHKQSGRPPAGYMWVWLGRLRRWRRRWFVAHTPGG
jgi:hypothetical protein